MVACGFLRSEMQCNAGQILQRTLSSRLLTQCHTYVCILKVVNPGADGKQNSETNKYVGRPGGLEICADRIHIYVHVPACDSVGLRTVLASTLHGRSGIDHCRYYGRTAMLMTAPRRIFLLEVRYSFSTSLVSVLLEDGVCRCRW